MQQRVPQLALLVRRHPNQRQPFHGPSLRRDLQRRGNRLLQTARRGRPCRNVGRRQRNPARPLHSTERLQATRKLGLPSRIEKTKRLAHTPRDPHPAGVRLTTQNRAQTPLRIRLPKRSKNLALDHHAMSYTSRISTCSVLLVGTG